MSDQKKSEDMSEDELDQIIADMSKEEEPAPTPAVSLVKGSKSTTPKSGAGADQALTMELTGAINLKLCFASGERSIEVICTEEALLCRMADGTEFRIPTGIAKKRNAA